ncbi:MAG: thrombospondin type 3 repeat-containing protein [Myxococcales bacterium]|nr:thrombospondin type 3 repeat-containing protein [Myxococcales bacterium]
MRGGRASRGFPRDLSAWLLAGAAGALVLAVGASSCSWDYAVSELAGDADPEVATDSAPDVYTLPDGRTCTGHEEDGDGVPDSCDNCPNVKNPGQEGGAIGTACLPAEPFISASAANRLLFDPFRSLSSWKAVGAGAGQFVEGLDGDSFLGGTTADGDLRFVFNKIGAATGAVVLTTEIANLEDAGGSAGVLLRVTSDFRFYICALSLVNGFAVARTPDIVAPATTACSGGPCAPVAFAIPGVGDAGPKAAQAAIPKDVLPVKVGDTVGLRASITTATPAGGDAAGTVYELECRVFNPRVPSTLLTKDPAYALKVTIPVSKLYANGEVGLYAQKSRASFTSVDVLSGP